MSQRVLDALELVIIAKVREYDLMAGNETDLHNAGAARDRLAYISIFAPI